MLCETGPIERTPAVYLLAGISASKVCVLNLEHILTTKAEWLAFVNKISLSLKTCDCNRTWYKYFESQHSKFF